MLRMTMGQLLVNEALPEDMRDPSRVLDKKGISVLLRELAQKHPEKYVEVSHKLSNIGRDVATEFGGYSFGLEHLRKSEASKIQQLKTKAQLKRILDNDDLTSEQRHKLIIKTVGSTQQQQIDDIFTEAVKAKNPLAYQVVSGSRGNKMNVSSLLGGDTLYADHRDEVIPLHISSSYSQGLKPVEYWAATYGGRRGTLSAKFATRDAGYLSKQLNQISHRLMVIGDEDDKDIPNRGLPVDTDDNDNEGALLAKDVGGYKRNTVLTPKILKHLKSTGNDRILVRSPLTSSSPDGGIYARDVGVRERGTLPGRGEQVGLAAAQSLSEPLSQGQLSAKHSGGVAGQEKAVGGFAYVNQLIQVPKRFRGGAAHAEHDGLVSAIEPAPAGGHYVFIDNERHYVPADVALKVKKGDSIEAGDVLSEGFPNPATVTQYKGIGEGKRYFVNAFRQAMTDAGMKGNRRNIELLARGLINHVRLTDEYGEHVPDDVVPYSTMEHLYEPREGHTVSEPRRAVGRYLEQPVLHYSIGTKIRPSVLKELQSFGINEVTSHAEPPPFQAEMIRGMASLQNDPDWMTRMYGSGLKGSLLDATHRGAVSDELGTSFVPGLARGVDFGRVGAVRVPEKGTALPVEGQPFGDPRKPLDLPAQDKKKAAVPKQSGLFSGLFKTSEELEKEAFAFLKMAGPIKATVDTTTPSSTGSSTAAPATQAVAKPGALPSTNILPSAGPKPPSVPSPNIMSGGNNNLTTSSLPQPAPTASAPAGQVHPARLQDSWGTPKPFNPQAGMGQNPNAFSGGYVPTAGLLSQTDSPEMAANFVQGGGNPNDPSSGYGGQFGAVARFGSLMDMGAVAALTSGTDYVPGQYGGNGQHDDLLGGAESAKVHDWNAPKTVTPKAVSPLVKSQVNQQLATQGTQNPNHLTEALSALKGWKAGNPEFDALKAKNPNAPNSEIQKQLFNSAKRGVLLSKQGYTPGKPEFEAVRKKLSDEVLAGASVDQKISEAESGIAALQATNPADPQIAKYTEYLQHLKEFKAKGIPDSDVYAHIKDNIEPTGDMTDYDVLETIRGNKDTSHLLTKTFTSPVTGIAAQKAVTSGMYHTLKHVPFVNKLPGLRTPTPPVPGAGQVLGEAGQAGLKQGEKVVAKQVFKETEEAAAKAAAQKLAAKGWKPVLKKIPYLGWALEVYDAADTPEDELRAKFNSKLMGISGDPSLGDAGMYLLDNALNPGQSVRAAGIIAQDANKMFDDAATQAKHTEANRVAQRMAQVQYLENAGATRALTEAEQATLNAHKSAIATAYRSNNANPADDSEFKRLIQSKQQAALNVSERARQNIGQNAVDKVLAGTATPLEQDSFKQWVDAQRPQQTHTPLQTEGGHYVSGKWTPYTDNDHATLNQKYQQYVEIATKLAEKGRGEEAKVIMAKADEFAPNTAIRNRRLQEQELKRQQNIKNRQIAPPLSPTGRFGTVAPQPANPTYPPLGGVVKPN